MKHQAKREASLDGDCRIDRPRSPVARACHAATASSVNDGLIRKQDLKHVETPAHQAGSIRSNGVALQEQTTALRLAEPPNISRSSVGRLSSSCSINTNSTKLTYRKLALMLKSLLKRTNDLSALILRMLRSAVSIQHGPQRVLARFCRLSVELRWEDSHARSQALRRSRRRSQIVRTNFARSMPDNDYSTLPPSFVGIWILPCFLACFRYW